MIKYDRKVSTFPWSFELTTWNFNVPVYHRTRRSITNHGPHETELIAAGPANWQRGTLHTNGGPWFDGK
jgi:hypothetical protein